MELDWAALPGQTPLDEDEKADLLLSSLSTRAELDEFEQLNIEEAMQWLYGRKLTAETVLSEKFIRNLHLRMFKKVWRWAGDFRRTNKNIGVDKWQVPTELKYLCDDTLFWIANQSFTPDEIAIRFKHRLVSIHCFANGNGRHSRLMADVIAEKVFKLPFYTWGSGNLIQASDSRKLYLSALRRADQNDFTALVQFARS